MNLPQKGERLGPKRSILKRIGSPLLAALSMTLTVVMAAGCTNTAYTSGVALPSGQVTTIGNSGSGTASTTSAATPSAPAVTGTAVTGTAVPVLPEVSYDLPDQSTNAATITLGNTITTSGRGVEIDGNVVTITSAGTYTISGTLEDGQIVVDTDDKDLVRLVLSGVDVTSSTGSPIHVVSGKSTEIALAEGTTNRVTDSERYTSVDSETGEPDAAIFSTGDLWITGGGSLAVDASYRHGIVSKDALRLTGGSISVEAVSDGIRGRDFIAVKDGTIVVNAGSDGLQSNNDEDAERGFVVIEGGSLQIVAANDGIQAETTVLVSGGAISITSGEGSANSSTGVGQAGNTWGNWGGPAQSVGATTDTPSAKGIKAAGNLVVTGGTLEIDASDDALHSNGALTVSGGTIEISSGDDGVHADSAIAIEEGTLTIAKCYEGIESKAITISGGEIHVVSADDAINVAGGDGSAAMGRPGPSTFSTLGDQYLKIEGGYISIQASGDGIDVNSAVTMSAGTLLISGPTMNGNGSLDYDAGFQMTGGLVVAAGSSGMALAPDSTSSIYSVLMTFPSQLPAGTLVNVQTQDGKDVLTFEPTMAYQTVVLSSSELKSGESYVVYSGGSYEGGSVSDGVYSGGTYSGGSQAATVTVSSVVTTAGSPVGGIGVMGGPGRMR